MSQEQIRREPNRRHQQQDENLQGVTPPIPSTAGSAHFNAIDDAIRAILSPAAVPVEQVGVQPEQRTVRPTTTSEEFVRNFRQQGGE